MSKLKQGASRLPKPVPVPRAANDETPRTQPDDQKFEAEVLSLLSGGARDPLIPAAVKRWWIELDGAAPPDLEAHASAAVSRHLAELHAEIEQLPRPPAWIEHRLLVRTINVIQRLQTTTVTPSQAIRILQAVGRLAILGVHP